MRKIYILIRNIFILLLFFFLLSLFNNDIFAGENGIKINEVMFDPIGSDLGYEWIELYNPSSDDISLDGWKIQSAGTKFTDSTIISGNIPSQSFFTICELKVQGCNLNVSKLSFQNGGGATDGIQIVDSGGNIIDQVFYDTPNINNLTNQNGIIVKNDETSLLGKSGETIGRVNLVDTDNSAKDFFIFSTPSLGEQNIVNISQDSLVQTGQSPIFFLFPFIILAFSAMLLYSFKLFFLK